MSEEQIVEQETTLEEKDAAGDVHSDVENRDDDKQAEKAKNKKIKITQEEYDALCVQVTEFHDTKDKLLRTLADFENSKRRLEKQKDEFVQYANKKIIQEFLPIIDNLQRAIQSAEANHSVESLIEGVTMINKQMLDVLAGHGMTRIVSLGQPFDPHVHEAIGSVESEEHDDETVIEEVVPGYMYKETLLRPTVVRISMRPETAQTDDEAEGTSEEDTNSNNDN